MKIALLGAGFTRNWGGWLASEVMGELCGRLRHQPELVQALTSNPNFEAILGQVRQRAAADPNLGNQLQDLETAIRQTFDDMNEGLANVQFEFSQDRQRSISSFLTQFDAIFTLNQDLLLEMHYTHPIGNGRWMGIQYPGVPLPAEWHGLDARQRNGRPLYPAQAVNLDNNNQPIFKLHGSSNWFTEGGNPIMVMGEGKTAAIDGSPLLSEYRVHFNQYLNNGETDVMVIGYSFSDEHINEALLEAASNTGMRMYLVNPAGVASLRRSLPGTIAGPEPLLDIPLTGVSTRSLRDTFAVDELSFRSFRRFIA